MVDEVTGCNIYFLNLNTVLYNVCKLSNNDCMYSIDNFLKVILLNSYVINFYNLVNREFVYFEIENLYVRKSLR